MEKNSNESTRKEKNVSLAIFILVIAAIILIFIVLYLITQDFEYTSVFIGISGFLATLFAIYYAWLSTQETHDKLDNIIKQMKIKTLDEHKASPEMISEEKILSIGDRHVSVELMIDRLLAKYKISYSKQGRNRSDYIIYYKERVIPIEIKIYPKRISLPFSERLIKRLNYQMVEYMKINRTKESLLMIWNPGVNKKQRERIYGMFNNRITIINRTTFDSVENAFEEYLQNLIYNKKAWS